MRVPRALLFIAAGVLAGAQFWPVDRDNPPLRGEFEAPPEVLGLLKRACYDCHSNETRWPWYGYIAPFSWFLGDHIEEGRAELSFSEWSTYPAKRKQKKLEEILEELEEGEMPLFSYTLLHRDAVLSPEELAVLKAWANGG